MKFGNTKIKPWLGSLVVSEHELELGQNHVPISTTGRPVLPGRYFRHDLLADLAHQLRRDVDIIQALDLLRDIPLAHPAGIQP